MRLGAFAHHGQILLRPIHRHRIMDGATVTHEICVRHDELFQRSLDLVEVDVGDEPINAGIDGGRLWPVHVAVRRDEMSEHLEIREPTRVGGIGGEAADALEVIALEIEFLRLAQARFGQARVLAQQP